MNSANQSEIDTRNADFWNELCGTQLARSLGITDFSPASLKKFDDYYFDLYPYLAGHAQLAEVTGKDVLEIGLGYGSLSQKIAEAGARYSGLDIARGPVDMVNHRLSLLGLPGSARQGSILAAPYADNSFDHVISIGCIHHTGDIQQALSEIRRVLKPGGFAMVMIYSAYSYRRWAYEFMATFRYFLWDYFGVGTAGRAGEAARAAYDKGSMGAAPETAFTSPRQFRLMAKDFATVSVECENAGFEGLLRFFPRPSLLPTIGRWMGLDLYCALRK